MIADKKFIQCSREKSRMIIPKDLEDFLLEEYGEEPFPYEYTEQDLYEQIRKLEIQYHKGLLDVTVKGPELRLRERYEALQDEYMDAMYKIRELEDEVEKLRGILGIQAKDAADF